MRTHRDNQPLTKTSDLVMFNFRRPTRARLIGGTLWLVEAYDAANDVWVWQTESAKAEDALESARQLSLNRA
ncbi:MAG: hypothetical protein JO171_03735 [Paludibacterium sp.]|uniref:hypothetical protein n=1 Tax=Paludibacterium sp. TaxID=1917523 RepID=UPI0025D1E652|nr:hypothetical protein [Paludibacterium sp.]MBV8046236.1 hypothetical protein [Paludibacterium sp.]MBV8649444.1 hypothetical protein [Paludibacterium sp.]